MRRFLLASSIIAGTAALTLPANAAPIIYQLNTIITGNTLTHATPSLLAPSPTRTILPIASGWTSPSISPTIPTVRRSFT